MGIGKIVHWELRIWEREVATECQNTRDKDGASASGPEHWGPLDQQN